MALRAGVRPALGRSGDVYPSLAPSSDFTDTCREIDCLRGVLPAGLLAEAEERAARVGVGADRVLIAAGKIDEETYLRAHANALALPFDSLDGVARARCPIDDERLIDAAAAGVLPLMVGGKLHFVVATRGLAARRIGELVGDKDDFARKIRFTTARRLNSFVFRHASAALTARACTGLKRKWPALSAAPPRWRARLWTLILLAGAAIAASILAPSQTALVVELFLALIFLAWFGLRLLGLMIEPPRAAPARPLRNAELPVYTILCALKDEASSVDGLLSAIENLDYPREKLDVKLVIEADDADTATAIAARKTRIPVEVITAPDSKPRTKPKALNIALPFARGSFTVVYDAEDRPEPAQLRRALESFAAGGDKLACVQARLSIDNTTDSWLAGLFTAEYAGQFDVFLPGIAALELPLPLGGSSNHFRTTTLRQVGGWDAYNVTEDADLGMRLARFGYRVGMIDSTTYEEAPARFVPWLYQRTRWFKGWMQTWLVHMREPRQLMRDLGPARFTAFQLVVGGNALAALVHPLFLGWLVYALVSGGPGRALVALLGASVIIGYAISAFLAWCGLARRGLRSTAWVLALTPLHWLLLSLAAWRALFQLFKAPYRWEKTKHGLAKNSRRAERRTRSLLQLEQLLTSLQQSGELPALSDKPTYISAARRPTPRAAA
jgi:cellulose synthase/poly-beta-1,6-N-acetylglucosamine synthase-like glycosyltransferase